MTQWLAVLGEPLARGPYAAFLAAFAVSPGIPALIAAVFERRVFRLRYESVAFLLGDPLLALATALGVAACGGRPPAAVAPLVSGPVAITCVLGALMFGLWQWRGEVRAGKYSWAQALSPTKIWHQVAVYPLLGYLLNAALIAGMAAPNSPARLGAKGMMIVCVAAWLAANHYDTRHPKLSHPPYDWRRLQPLRPPWPQTSASLRAATRSCEKSHHDVQVLPSDRA